MIESPPVEPILQQSEQLETYWAQVLEAIRQNPAAIQPYLPNISPDQLDEVVKTIGQWLKRVRAPSGFAPGFHVAKGVGSTSLAAAVTASQALARGEYGHFQNFVVALNQILSALHSMLVFSDKATVRDAVAELGGKLAEALALLDTAQKELGNKTTLLKAAEASATTAAEAASAITEARERSVGLVEEITKLEEGAREKAAEMAEDGQEITALKESLLRLSKENSDIAEKLKEHQDQVESIAQRASEQEDLISALLPKGASTGLASAFGARVGQLERTKWIWMGSFLLSIVGLAVVAYMVVELEPTSTEELWRQILHRIPLAAPFIWLGWFSAIQYGNTLRVQEDYAFKEATSKAFAGYRDHMEHMASVSLKEGNTAMALLAAHTVEILSREPLRIFGDTDKDASPGHGLLHALGFRRGIWQPTNGSERANTRPD